MIRTKLLQLWQEDDGVISFEWTMLVTLLVIGVISGIAGARDAIIDEFSDVSEATVNWDQSYSLPATVIMDSDGNPAFTLTEQTFTDDGAVFNDCGRGGVDGQDPESDIPN
jgi:Flp pilus assembly pilin Flp